MFTKLQELVNKLPKEQQSEFLAEMGNLVQKGLIEKPKSLEELFKNEEFADLKKQQDALLGSYRTKWEKEELEKLKTPTPPDPNKKEPDEFQSKMFKMFEDLNKEITGLKTTKQIENLKNYSLEKTKDLPKEFQTIIQTNIRDGMTESEVDKQVELFKAAQANMMKKIDETPTMGGIKPQTDAEFDSFLTDKSKELEPTKI